MHEKIIILDFGGQYAHLIASRIRREKVLAEIYNPDEVSVDFIKQDNIKGIILSGGPQSVYDEGSQACALELFKIGIPVLGICYGHQYLNHSLGGKVVAGEIKEYGRAELVINPDCPLFANIPDSSVFWMSHGDEVEVPAEGFEKCGESETCNHAAVWHPEKNLYGIQFHPEVTHSEYGGQLLKNFLGICAVSHDWTIEKFLEEESNTLKQQIGDRNVFLFVSGGVDSSVSLAFLTKILGPDRVKGLFVDTGLMRKNETELVEKSLKDIGADLTVIREADTFLENLKGVTDPEKKREIIGHTFLEVQQRFFEQNDISADEWLLAQGTIYPDTIETGGTKNAAKIKTHHNRAPDVQKLIDEGKVIEPIKELYKDEVRALGEKLGLPHGMVWRHPFPGPGLGVRILCSPENKNEILVDEINAYTLSKKKKPYRVLPIKSVGVQGDFRTYRHPGVLLIDWTEIEEMEKMATKLINHYPDINRCLKMIHKNYAGPMDSIQVKAGSITPERVEMLQEADAIVTRHLEAEGLYEKVWQFPVVLAPVAFNNTGEESIILRPIDSVDAMSASVGKLPWEFLEICAADILKDKRVSAVFLDVTSKPPGTIEWE